MKVNKQLKLKPFQFLDTLNINYSPYYTITNGVYKFFDRITQIKCMYKYGIDCLCTRLIKNNTLIWTYNNKEITEQQKDFLRKRAQALEQTIQYSTRTTTGIIKNDCGCKKKRQE